MQVPSNPREPCQASATFVQSLSGAEPGGALFGPTRYYTTTLQPTFTDRSPIFHTGNGQRVPGSGQPGTSQCDKSPEEEQLFFALLIRSASLLVQTASNSFIKTWVSPQHKGKLCQSSPKKELLSVRSYPTGVMPAVRLVIPWMNRDTKHIIGDAATGASRGRGV